MPGGPSDCRYVGPVATGLSLGTLQKDSYVYFVIDNWGSWGSDENLVRFRLTLSP